MLNQLLTNLRGRTSNDSAATRRRFPRRERDRCVCELNGRPVPVENWSFGGLLLVSDDRLYSRSEAVDVVLKFKLRNSILDIPVKGHVVRKMPGMVGIEFEPLNQSVRRRFQQVVDDSVAREFANSQA